MMRRNPDTPRLLRPSSLDDVLLYRISRLLSTAGAIVIRLCEGGFGITRREWRLIALLAEEDVAQEDGVLSSQLAERAQLDRARTSRAVTSLVDKKLIRRTPGPSDKREVRLALTDSGRALYEQLFPLVLGVNRELLAPLSAAQAKAIDRGLDELQRRADAMVQRAQSPQSQLPKADRRRGGRMRARLG
jgi:DNA-binding MarR family transcriptional regulator